MCRSMILPSPRRDVKFRVPNSVRSMLMSRMGICFGVPVADDLDVKCFACLFGEFTQNQNIVHNNNTNIF